MCSLIAFGARNVGKSYLLNGLVGRQILDYGESQAEQVLKGTCEHEFVEVPEYTPDAVATRIGGLTPKAFPVFLIKLDNGRLRHLDATVIQAASPHLQVVHIVMTQLSPKMRQQVEESWKTYLRYLAPSPAEQQKVRVHFVNRDTSFDEEGGAAPRLSEDVFRSLGLDGSSLRSGQPPSFNLTKLVAPPAVDGDEVGASGASAPPPPPSDTQRRPGEGERWAPEQSTEEEEEEEEVSSSTGRRNPWMPTALKPLRKMGARMERMVLGDENASKLPWNGRGGAQALETNEFAIKAQK